MTGHGGMDRMDPKNLDLVTGIQDLFLAEFDSHPGFAIMTWNNPKK